MAKLAVELGILIVFAFQDAVFDTEGVEGILSERMFGDFGCPAAEVFSIKKGDPFRGLEGLKKGGGKKEETNHGETMSFRRNFESGLSEKSGLIINGEVPIAFYFVPELAAESMYSVGSLVDDQRRLGYLESYSCLLMLELHFIEKFDRLFVVVFGLVVIALFEGEHDRILFSRFGNFSQCTQLGFQDLNLF